MRAIRDKLSREIMDMSFEEEKDYIKKQLSELKTNSLNIREKIIQGLELSSDLCFTPVHCM
ncbi:MAG: hypothetical protein ACLFM7_12020 [Bacteroidales bacterium]